MKIKLIMPSEGDMELLEQTGGSIVLKPTFYGNEASGPHIHIIENGGTVVAKYRLKFKGDGKVEIKQSNA